MAGGRGIFKNIIKVLFGLPILRSTARNLIFLKSNKVFPPILQVEITNACNACCTICPHEKIRREIGQVDEGLFRRIIDECSRHPVHMKSILLNHFGEPFLNPRLEEFIRYVKAAMPAVQTAMFSNGSLIDDARAEAIVKSGLDLISVSFDGFSKKTYETIRRNLNFESVNANINRLLEARRRLCSSKPRIEISYVEVEENKNETEAFIAEWKPRVDKVNIGVFCNWGGAVPENLGTKETLLKRKRKPCIRLWSHMLIFRNGDVPLCCQDYDGIYLLGNVRRQSIQEIWHGEILNRYRMLHEKGAFDEIPICKVCNFWEQQTDPIWWW